MVSIKEQIISNKSKQPESSIALLSKKDTELLDSAKDELKEQLKDILIFCYPDTTGNELTDSNIKIIDNFKIELNDIIQEYRNNNITYKVIMYSPFEYFKFIGIDTFNKDDPLTTIRLNADYTRNSCIHFKTEKYIDDYKENIDINKIQFYNYVKPNIVEFYSKFSMENSI